MEDAKFQGMLMRIASVTNSIKPKDLGPILGITPAAVSKALTQKHIPQTWLNTLATKYNLTHEWLIYGEDLIGVPKHDGTMRRDGTITHGGDVVREQSACPHCTELYEKLVDALNKAMQAQENAMQIQKQKEVLLEENAALRAENRVLTERLSLFTNATGESA